MQEVRKKERAIQLRKRGLSIRKIEANLHIPRSTLSGWLKNVPLTRVQRNNLRRAWERGLDSARQKAAECNRAAKAKRLQLAQEEARRAMIIYTRHGTARSHIFMYIHKTLKRNGQ